VLEFTANLWELRGLKPFYLENFLEDR